MHKVNDKVYYSDKLEAKGKPKLKGKMKEAPSAAAEGNLERVHFAGTPSLVVPNLTAHQWIDFVPDETAEGNLELWTKTQQRTSNALSAEEPKRQVLYIALVDSRWKIRTLP